MKERFVAFRPQGGGVYFNVTPLADEKLGNPDTRPFWGAELLIETPYFMLDPGPMYLPDD